MEVFNYSIGNDGEVVVKSSIIEDMKYIVDESLVLPDEIDNHLLKKADKELECLRGVFIDLINRVKTEKPDFIYFLGQSSHIFRQPFSRYLKSLWLKNIKIESFNDSDIKWVYKKWLWVPDVLIKEKYWHLTWKKAFFIDETYNTWKWAMSLKYVKNYLWNNDIFYYSLTKSSAKHIRSWETVCYNNFLPIVKSSRLDLNFIMYGIDSNDLFSRQIKNYYLVNSFSNWRSEILNKWCAIKSGRYKKSYPWKVVRIPCEEKKYNNLIRSKELSTVKEVRRKIFDFFNSLDLEK